MTFSTNRPIWWVRY